MTAQPLVVGLDGSPSGEKALAFAKNQVRKCGGGKIVICYVIEWSPYTFQTPEENEQRHLRREEELTKAHDRILDPAVSAAKSEGFEAEGVVRHGDAAEILERIAVEHGAGQIIIGRIGARGLRERLFGGVSGRLVATATVPVTIIP